MLGGGREPDDVRPVVGEHRLVPCDALLELRIVLTCQVSYVSHLVRKGLGIDFYETLGEN